MGKTDCIQIEVAFAEPRGQHLITLEVPAGTTVAGAIELCRRRQLLPGAAFDYADRGIFGRRAPADRVLESGDRVEIYRPLKVDPKEARRRRAQRKRPPARRPGR